MIINMGPQHPSTHGVLRIMMELDAETVVRAKPVIGYLHTGMEKTGEELTYVQGATNVTRMDYASPLSNELVYSIAVERLLDIEVPERAHWIRMLLVELNRMSSHLLFQATNGMDIGAISMMIYGWREREQTLRLLEDDHRPADEPQLHPPRRRRRRPARRLAGERARNLRDGRARGRRVRRAAHEQPDLARAHGRRRASSPPSRRSQLGAIRPDPALDRLPVGPAQGAAVPRLRRGRLRRHLHRERRLLRSLPDPAPRDPRVDQDRAPVRREDARGRLPDPGPQGHAAAARSHRRVDGGADPPLQALHRGLQGAAGRDLRRDGVAAR